MLKGFIVGLIVGLAALAALMVLFPMAPEEPAAPAPAAVESGADAPAGAAEEEPAGDAGDAAAPEADTAPAPETTPGEAPAGTQEEETDDRTRAPAPETATESETAAAPPQATAAGEAPEQAEAAAGPAQLAAGDAPEQPAAEEAAAQTAAAPGVTDPPLRLPTVARASETLKPPVTDPEAQPAWRRNGVAFDAPRDQPLLAVVLTAAVTGPAPSIRLSDIGAPVTMAVPASPGGAEAAGAYRRAGIETLLLVSLAPGADQSLSQIPSDAGIAEAVRKVLSSFDSVVGVANPGGARNAELRVARAVMDELAAAGLGYLHADRGGAASVEVRAAEERGIPTARQARVVDPSLSAPEIVKVLDLAAFDARRRGAAVAMGSPTEAMVQALVQWARDNDGRAARLAPFSAVLARMAQGG